MNALPTAVFLDRDGTIIEDAHYLSDPKKIKLVEGAAEAISRINAALIPVIVVTNQSGIGRGYFTLADHQRVSMKVDELLAQQGARIDASYHCPHTAEDMCACRKPGVALFEQAARENAGVILSQSLFIGDRMRDVEPALTLGGDGVLVPSRETPPEDIIEATARARVAPSLGTVLDWYLCTN